MPRRFTTSGGNTSNLQTLYLKFIFLMLKLAKMFWLEAIISQTHNVKKLPFSFQMKRKKLIFCHSFLSRNTLTVTGKIDHLHTTLRTQKQPVQSASF